MPLSLYFDTYRCTGDIQQPKELILVHGWGMHSGVWDAIMPGLLQQFQVTVVDLPGLGRSPIPGGEYDLDYLTHHVLQIAPRNAVWVGWSLGGMVAMNAAAHFPDRVSALVTVCSTPKFVADDAWPLAMQSDVMQAFMQMMQEDAEGTLIRFLSLQCKGSNTIKDDIRQLKEWVHFHGLPAPKALRCGLDVLAAVDLRSTLKNITAPTLHVFGEKDHLVPVGVSKAIAQLQPSASTSVIRGVSHVPFISEPELFLAACNDFFSDCL